METDLDVHQFLSTIYRYIQIGVHIKAFYSKEYGQFHREVDEVCEFYVDDNNEPKCRIIYQKQMGKIMMCKPSEHLREYLENQNIDIKDIIKDLPDELPIVEISDSVKEEEKPQPVEEKKEENPVGGETTTTNTTPVVETPTIDATPVVPDPSLPGAKPDEVESTEPGAEVGIAESIPVVSSEGNVQLSNSVVEAPAAAIMNQVEAQPVVPETVPTPPPVVEAQAPIPAPPVANGINPNQLPQAATNQQLMSGAIPQQAQPILPGAPIPQNPGMQPQQPAIPVPQAPVAPAQQPAIPNVVPNLVTM